MKDMTENRKLDSASSYDGCGSEEKTSSQKISVSDHINGFQYTTYKPDSFVIDMESFSHGGTSKEINPNSRITLQRSLSRKGSQRGDKKIITPNCVNSNSSSTLDDRDSVAATNPSYRGLLFSSSHLTKKRAVTEFEFCWVFNKLVQSSDSKSIVPFVDVLLLDVCSHVLLEIYGSSTLEKPTAVAVGSTDYASNPQVHHQITITTGNIAAATDSRFSLRRNSFRRSPPPWLLDPKRILMFFATLSSMGTILLIYFTLSVSKMNGDENALD